MKGISKRAFSRPYRLLALALLAALISVPAGAWAKGGGGATNRQVVAAQTGTFWVPDAVFNPSADDGLPVTWGTAETFFRPTFAGPQPLLAASAVQVGRTVWAVTLKPGITFQNGKRLDARAAVDWLKYELKNDPVVGALLPGVTAVKAVTALTFTITTQKPVFDLPAVFADFNAAVFDAGAARSVAPDWNKLVGKGAWTGPFSLTQLKPGREIVLTRNKNYWQGQPYLERVVFVRVPDEQAALRAIQAEIGRAHV